MELKSVIRAQHSKIEEMRKREIHEHAPLYGVMDSIAQREKEDHEHATKERDEYRVLVNSLRGELQKVKKDNDTLRKANRRLRAMLQGSSVGGPRHDSESSEHGSLLPHLSSNGKDAHDMDLHALSSPSDPAMTAGHGMELALLSARRASIESESASISDLGSTARDPVERRGSLTHRPSLLGGSRARRMSGSCTMGASSHTSRLLAVLPGLWKAAESPAAVLGSLSDICSRLLSDLPHVTITVYALDPWLRAALSEESDGHAPALFYLAQGKLQLQVVGGVRAGAARPDAPVFQSLQGLPYCTRTALVASLHARGDRHFAVLQAQLSSEDEPPKQERSSQVGRRRSSVASLSVTMESFFSESGAAPGGFTESAKEHVQVACQVAAAALAHIEQRQDQQRCVAQARGCLEIAAEANKAKSLQDFEQRAKHLLSIHFNVTSVRVLFYDQETARLHMTPQISRLEPTAFQVSQGIIGMVARKMQVVHVPRISRNPMVDHFADGLERGGRPVAPDAAMLVGPMVLEGDTGRSSARLLGVVQLLERSRHAPAEKTQGGVSEGGAVGQRQRPGGGFTAEEQSLFSYLLRVFAVVVARTWKMQLQAAAARPEAGGTSLPRLLAER